MSFEQDLRNQLNDHVPAMPLQGAGADAAIARSRQRERRRRAGVAIVAVAVLGLGTVGIVQARSGSDDLPVASQPTAPLEDLGPLKLSWQTTPGGLGFQMATAKSENGAVYVLSTAPGTRLSDYPSGDVPQALYRLADDGTWEPISVRAGSDPHLVDLGASGDLLYSLGTSPSAGPLGYDAVLSSSSDRGTTWESTLTQSVAPPSSQYDWQPSTSLQIATSGAEGVVVLSTSFTLSTDDVFAALAAQGVDASGEDRSLAGTTITDEGLQVSIFDGEVSTSPTSIPATGSDPHVMSDGTMQYVHAERVIGTVTWSTLGISGRDAFEGTSQVLVKEGDSWVPTDSVANGLAGWQIGGVDVVGSGFVARAYSSVPGGRSATFFSEDGRVWTPVTLPSNESQLFGVGSAWLAASYQPGAPFGVSADHGRTWTDLDPASIDPRLADTNVWTYDAGPLGVAAVMSASVDGAPRYLVATRDLVNWTVTPVSDLIESGDRTMSISSVVVGTDRVVLVATLDAMQAEQAGELADSVTLVGIPTRD